MSKMFNVSLVETIQYYRAVEADNAQEAIAKTQLAWEDEEYDWEFWGDPADSESEYTGAFEHHDACSCEGCSAIRGVTYWSEP